MLFICTEKRETNNKSRVKVSISPHNFAGNRPPQSYKGSNVISKYMIVLFCYDMNVLYLFKILLKCLLSALWSYYYSVHNYPLSFTLTVCAT